MNDWLYCNLESFDRAVRKFVSFVTHLQRVLQARKGNIVCLYNRNELMELKEISSLNKKNNEYYFILLDSDDAIKQKKQLFFWIHKSQIVFVGFDRQPIFEEFSIEKYITFEEWKLLRSLKIK